MPDSIPGNRHSRGDKTGDGQTLFIHSVQKIIHFDEVQSDPTVFCGPGDTALVASDLAGKYDCLRCNYEIRPQVKGAPFHGSGKHHCAILRDQRNAGTSRNGLSHKCQHQHECHRSAPTYRNGGVFSWVFFRNEEIERGTKLMLVQKRRWFRQMVLFFYEKQRFALIPVARNPPFDIAVKKRLVNVHPLKRPVAFSMGSTRFAVPYPSQMVSS